MTPRVSFPSPYGVLVLKYSARLSMWYDVFRFRPLTGCWCLNSAISCFTRFKTRFRPLTGCWCLNGKCLEVNGFAERRFRPLTGCWCLNLFKKECLS